MPNLLHHNEVVTPSDAEATLAKESSRTLAAYVGNEGLRIQLKSENGVNEITLPLSVARVLLGILTEMGKGNAVAVAPVQAELTTNQAAELLNVSRPHLTKLLDEGVIPFRKVGTHSRVRLRDVMAYRDAMYTERRATLDELTQLSQDMGLYDGSTK